MNEIIEEVVKALEKKYHLIPKRSHYDSKHLEPYMILDIVIGEVAKYYSVSPDRIRSQNRGDILPQCRQIYFYIARLVSHKAISLNYMADYVNRNHSTGVHSIKKLKALMQFEPELREEVDVILKKVQEVLSDKKAELLDSLKNN